MVRQDWMVRQQFCFKHLLFGEAIIVKNSDKSMFIVAMEKYLM